jgi:uncharacterized membrane protein
MLHILIILFSIVGVVLCIQIYHKKRQEKLLVCPLGADCNTVFKSDFSTFYGIHLEIIGMFYYVLIGGFYFLLTISPILQNSVTYFILFIVSFAAFLFSLYLIFVQAVLIKSWCSWCLMSAGLTTLILISSIFGIIIEGISFIPILEFIKHPLVLIHLIGFALGVGGATINDILFFRFLKDYKISHKEDATLKIMSETIWVGLALLIISGIGLYLPNAETLNQSSKFLVKAVVVGIITLNGAFLNLYIAPHLKKITFKDHHTKTTQVSPLRKIAFVSGAISFVSWYTAFFLGTVQSIPLNFIKLFGIYLILVISASVFSLFIEKIYCTHTDSTKIK